MKKGFTLIELLVVVLIVGVLASFAIPVYFRAVERARLAEAETLMAQIAQAQRLRYIRTGSYAQRLDALGLGLKTNEFGALFTKGARENGYGGNGFGVGVSGTEFDQGRVIATRMAKTDAGAEAELPYQYALERRYQYNYTTCVAFSPQAQRLCADFCGVEGLTVECCNDGKEGVCQN